MKRIYQCAFALFMLSGCSAYNDKVDDFADGAFRMYVAKPLYETDGDTSKIRPSLLDVVIKKEGSNQGIIDEGCYTFNESNEELCKQQRNIAISTLMLTSEEICVKHRRNIYGNEAGSSLFFGTLTNVFSGTATVVSPATTKSIFAALSFFTNAERSLVNETIYKQMMVSAIDNKIVSKRDESARDIVANLGKPIDQYSVAQAMYDVSAFHNKCSFMEGLRYALVEGEGNVNSRKADALKREINEIEMKMLVFKDSNKNDDPVLVERRKKLYEMLNQLGAPIPDSEPVTANKQ